MNITINFVTIRSAILKGMIFGLLLILCHPLYAEESKINRMWADYSAYENGQKGIRVHADINIRNHKGELLIADFMFGVDDDDPTKCVFIKSSDPQYSMVSYNERYLGKTKNLKCSYDNSRWKDLSVFVPYSLFPDGTCFCCQLYINDKSNNILDTELIYFHFKQPHRKRSDIIDNTEQIKKLQASISELEDEKAHCYSCHGSGKVKSGPCMICYGKGFKQIGDQIFNCTTCKGTGINMVSCSWCVERDQKLMALRILLQNAKESDGMSKKAYEVYLQAENEKLRQQLEFQKSQSNSNRSTTNTVRSTTNSVDTKCSKCGGTGYDPFPSSTSGVGGWIGVFHDGKSKCPYCGRWESHWHDKCPSCSAPQY